MDARGQRLQVILQFDDPAGATHGHELVRQGLCRGSLVPRGRRLSQDKPDLRVIRLGGPAQSVLSDCTFQGPQFVPGPLQPTMYRHIRSVVVPRPELPLDEGQRMRELEVRHSRVPGSPDRSDALVVPLRGHTESLGGIQQVGVYPPTRGLHGRGEAT